MQDYSYQRVSELDDKAKPWRRIYRCPATGLFVKLHVKRIDTKFGRISWAITGALCDERGTALRDENGDPLVHTRGHRFSVASDDAPGADSVARMAQDLEAQSLYVVARVESAALKREAAAAL